MIIIISSSSLLSLISLTPSGLSLSKVLSRIQLWKQNCFHPYLQKAIYQFDPESDVNPKN